ncbi:MAG: tRNA uridine-5-carboxymethylaminomethyl(34) synthesis GTPase MnmE [Erysipelotrichaceae bacterium]|nr:tRNA uridine-5-carboxymethylaminomethyl(34) synthesis GTPase MnmE [Erysipelotrichaceae bacterium]
MNETIAAISTALGVGAISIIRISGTDSINIVNKIFKGKDLTTVDTHTIHYGHIVNKDELIDEVLVSVMKAPKTFTTEDIVEINSHGGISTTNKVLELLLLNGARLAEPGEFTKRAFLNGRIDLIEADGIMNLISSKTEKARILSMNQLSGKVTNNIRKLRDKLIGIVSNIEVNIDYPEYEDIEEVTNEKLYPKLVEIEKELEHIISKSEEGKIINQGINVGIIGRPNVGKSSLLNALLEEEKAIVTDIEGTTRDIVEGTINLDGIILNIIDTAGIRETDNIVEKIGVEKSKNIMDNCDLIILMLNHNEALTSEDLELLNHLKEKKHLVVINKIDLEEHLDYSKLPSDILKLSIKNDIGIEQLKDRIKKLFNLEELETEDLTYLSDARSISLLKTSLNDIKESISSIKNQEPIEMVEINIKNAWESLGEIIGETYKEELIDELFSRFCLGK